MQANSSQADTLPSPNPPTPTPPTPEGLWPVCWEIPGIQDSTELGSGFKRLLHPNPYLDNGNSAGYLALGEQQPQYFKEILKEARLGGKPVESQYFKPGAWRKVSMDHHTGLWNLSS